MPDLRARRSHDAATGPATVGTEPAACDNAPLGGATETRTVPSGLGSMNEMPSRVSCMATSAEDPHPWDMESPMRSLGV